MQIITCNNLDRLHDTSPRNICIFGNMASRWRCWAPLCQRQVCFVVISSSYSFSFS